MTYQEFPVWSWVLGLVIGAATGSFLNMVIHRLPRQLSFWDPPKSFCPKCKHSLKGIDLIPLLSWLSTRGRCRYCKEPIAARYFWVEVLTGALFAALWWQYLIASFEPLRMAFYMLAAAALVAIIFIDWELYIIPDEINAFLFVVGVTFHGIQGTWQTALWGAFAGWATIWGIALLGRTLFKKDAMGDGDVKMMRGVGALIGPLLLFPNVFLAVVTGLVGGIVGIVIEQRKAAAAAPSDESYPELTPTPIGFMFLSGAWYLLCLDIVALFVKPLDRWITRFVPQEILDEDDQWQPSLTTIPFGPYLAVGALICMLFAVPLERALRQYLQGGALS